LGGGAGRGGGGKGKKGGPPFPIFAPPVFFEGQNFFPIFFFSLSGFSGWFLGGTPAQNGGFRNSKPTHGGGTRKKTRVFFFFPWAPFFSFFAENLGEFLFLFFFPPPPSPLFVFVKRNFPPHFFFFFGQEGAKGGKTGVFFSFHWGWVGISGKKTRVLASPSDPGKRNLGGFWGFFNPADWGEGRSGAFFPPPFFPGARAPHWGTFLFSICLQKKKPFPPAKRLGRGETKKFKKRGAGGFPGFFPGLGPSVSAKWDWGIFCKSGEFFFFRGGKKTFGWAEKQKNFFFRAGGGGGFFPGGEVLFWGLLFPGAGGGGGPAPVWGMKKKKKPPKSFGNAGGFLGTGFPKNPPF